MQLMQPDTAIDPQGYLLAVSSFRKTSRIISLEQAALPVLVAYNPTNFLMNHQLRRILCRIHKLTCWLCPYGHPSIIIPGVRFLLLPF